MWLKTDLILSISIIFLKLTIAANIGDRCIPNDELTDGVCTMIDQCEPAVRGIKQQHRHEFQRCGFIGFTEIVCCPNIIVKSGELSNSGNGGASPEKIVERECKKNMKTRIPPLRPLILGGEITAPGEFPQMAALGYERSYGYEFVCGGSLISDRYLVTAAHCIDNIEQVPPSIVRLGVIDIGNNSWNADTDHRIDDVILHPNYTRREKYTDIALIRLQNAVTLSSNVNPVCLYTNMEDPVETLTATGWGKTSVDSDATSHMLLKTNVTAVSTDRCQKSYVNWRKLPSGILPTQLCAGDPAGEHDTCQGDSGGPLVKIGRTGHNYLVGVTSFGPGCGSPKPAVYTRIAAYLPWIQGRVWPQ